MTSKRRRVWKFFQDGIVSCRLEIFQCETEDWVQPFARVANVKIEGRELMPEMQLRIVIEGTADVMPNVLFERSSDYVAHGVKVKMKIKRHLVIESYDLVVKTVVEIQSGTNCD